MGINKRQGVEQLDKLEDGGQWTPQNRSFCAHQVCWLAQRQSSLFSIISLLLFHYPSQLGFWDPTSQEDQIWVWWGIKLGNSILHLKLSRSLSWTLLVPCRLTNTGGENCKWCGHWLKANTSRKIHTNRKETHWRFPWKGWDFSGRIHLESKML